MGEDSKKDLTSIVDLAKKELATRTEAGEAIPSLEQPPAEQVSESDFGNLEDASKAGTLEALSQPPPEVAMPSPETVDMVVPEASIPEAELETTSVPPVLSAEPVVAPPPDGVPVHAASQEPPAQKEDFSKVKKFGEKFAIGQPNIEASPPFSLMATLQSDEKKIKIIEDVLSSENYGVQFQEIQVQLKSGKLFIPKISEFAAVALAQKLHDIVDNIEIGLSNEIYKAKSIEGEMASDFDNVFYDAERFTLHREEVCNLSAEPQNERDLFATNLSHIEGYQITRILTALMVSKMVDAEIAEDQSGQRLEIETEALTKELLAKAFKLKAHGIIGVSFSLKSVEVQRSAQGKKKAYRLFATGTAVRVHEMAGAHPTIPSVQSEVIKE